MEANKSGVIPGADQIESFETPLINRIFFGVITALWIWTHIKVIIMYSQGADTMPFFFWIVFIGLALVGTVLINIKGDIKLRLHPFWTPLGLAIIAFVVNRTIASDNPVWDSLSETIYFNIGIGLLFAFFNLDLFKKYAYYFTVIAILATLESFPNGWNSIRYSMEEQADNEWWGIWMDQIYFMIGFLFLYYLIIRLKVDRLGWKKIMKSIGLFVLGAIVVMMTGRGVARLFPEKSWQRNWFTNNRATQNVSCSGSKCGQGLYVDPYKELWVETNNTGIFSGTGTTRFLMIVQDHDLIGCKYRIDSDTANLTIDCPRTLKGIGSKTVTFKLLESPMNQGNENLDQKIEKEFYSDN